MKIGSRDEGSDGQVGGRLTRTVVIVLFTDCHVARSSLLAMTCQTTTNASAPLRSGSLRSA
jgi:hypothetical protein